MTELEELRSKLSMSQMYIEGLDEELFNLAKEHKRILDKKEAHLEKQLKMINRITELENGKA